VCLLAGIKEVEGVYLPWWDDDPAMKEIQTNIPFKQKTDNQINW
jgi:hypothetical protein